MLKSISKVCGLNFYTTLNGLENSFGRVTVLEEEDTIARLQAEEDQRLYGGRPMPLDTDEIEDASGLSNSMSRNRSAPPVRQEDEPPAKAMKLEDHSGSFEEILSPLHAWLAQTTAPMAANWTAEQPYKGNLGLVQDAMALEATEIEFFKNVHMDNTPRPITSDAHPNILEEVPDMGLEAQIYYRNILDRYPLLPRYLARRLAEANSNRSERLQRRREEAVESGARSKISSNIKKSRFLNCRICDQSFARLKYLKRHEWLHTKEKPFLCKQCARAFKRPYLLRRHQQKLHMADPPDLQSTKMRANSANRDRGQVENYNPSTNAYGKS